MLFKTFALKLLPVGLCSQAEFEITCFCSYKPRILF